MVLPIPCPARPLTTQYPAASTVLCTCLPMSNARAPGRTTDNPAQKACDAQSINRLLSLLTEPTATVSHASPMKPSTSTVTSSFTRSPLTSFLRPGTPCTISSFTLMQLCPGKPYTSLGADT